VAWGAGIAMALLPCIARAQGNLSGDGLGYPQGQLSTAALGMGGGVAEFDPFSPLNPSALAGQRSIALHIQYDPEFRTVSTDSVTEHSTTSIFPLLSVMAPVGPHITVGFAASSFLERTWSTSETSNAAVGDTVIPSTATFKSDGGITDLRLAAGLQATSWLRVGLGLHYFTGEDRITITRTFEDTSAVKTVEFDQYTDYAFSGYAASIGVEVQPLPVLGIAASYRAGGTMRARLTDTTNNTSVLTNKATVPSRAGADIRFDGIPGLTIGARADWEGWSSLNGFGPALGAHDALELGGGFDLSGPRMSGDRPLLIRAGVRVRDLPFYVEGYDVHETDVSAGLGIPVSGQHGTLDLSLQHANRTAPVGVGETAWDISIGITVRP
jgi:hypothetical protein